MRSWNEQRNPINWSYRTPANCLKFYFSINFHNLFANFYRAMWTQVRNKIKFILRFDLDALFALWKMKINCHKHCIRISHWIIYHGFYHYFHFISYPIAIGFQFDRTSLLFLFFFAALQIHTSASQPRIHGVIWCALSLLHAPKYLPTYSPHTHCHFYQIQKGEEKKLVQKINTQMRKKRKIEIIKICCAIQWTRSARNIKM